VVKKYYKSKLFKKCHYIMGESVKIFFLFELAIVELEAETDLFLIGLFKLAS